MSTFPRCSVCDRKMLRAEELNGTTAVHEESGRRMPLDGTVCRICLTADGYVSESAYLRIREENAQ